VDLQTLPHHPRKSLLANESLDLCYDELKTEARRTWLNEEYMYQYDYGRDASGNCIINLSFVTRLGSVYVETEPILSLLNNLPHGIKLKL
jgi:hypothetical protein